MKYPLGREIFSTNLEMTLHYLHPSYDYMAKIMTIRRKEEYAEIKKYINLSLIFLLYGENCVLLHDNIYLIK
jgi:hypothetical protein